MVLPVRKSPVLSTRTAQVRDLSAHVKDIAGDAISPGGLEEACGYRRRRRCRWSTSTRYGPCVAGTGKFICIGLNYSDHAAETGAKVPPEPIIFMKATSAIVGPNDNVEIPRGVAQD